MRCLPTLPSFLLAALVASCLVACKPAAPPPAAAPDPGSAVQPAATSAAEAAALGALPGPKNAIQASMRKFMAVKRFHASMRMEGGARGATSNEVDFVAPDRYRMTMQGLGTQTIIGDTLYMQVRGKAMKMPLPAGTLMQWRDPARLADNEAGMTVQALGRDLIDGGSVRKYLVHHGQPQPVDVTMWIDSDDLPVQVRVTGTTQGQASVATIQYSRFDDPSITIEIPR